jgi:penicillin-binding protein 2
MKNMEKYGKMFGFGEKTFIDLPNEKSGKLPTIAWLNKVYGEGGASGGRLANFGIGQGEILVTPLQMAVYVSIIANEGTVYQPHIVKTVYNNITNRTEPMSFSSRDLSIDPSYFRIIKNAMYDVVNTPGGTALSAMVPGESVCGKTGTAQNPQGKDHSWFVCFSPKDNPKIAMCVFVENAGFGGAVAAPIARDLLKAFFHPEILDKKPEPVAPKPVKDTTIPAITYNR